MNVLDFSIVVALLVFFGFRGNRSLTFWALISGGAFAGYLIGIVLAPVIAKGMHTDLKKGLASLLLLFGLALLLGLVGMLAGRKLKMKVILSRFSTLDRILVLPYKLVAALIAVALLSQTLVYIPILSLQFVAQGSTILMATDKLLPASPLENVAENIAPDQFRKLRLAYDPKPLTYNSLVNAGEFRDVMGRTAPSVVKVSGRNCVGLGSGSGFVVAPGFVLTNAHVISGSSSVYIRDHDGAYPATPVLIDNDYDVAVLYSKFVMAKPLPLATSHAGVGAKGLTAGYPGGGDLQVSEGVVRDRVYKSSNGKLGGLNTLTLSSTLGPGSSGGPVFNLKGEVMAVNVAGASGDLVAIRAEVVSQLVSKAKGKLPAKTGFCAVAPKFY
jgi:S1-C subfamily serine protease